MASAFLLFPSLIPFATYRIPMPSRNSMLTAQPRCLRRNQLLLLLSIYRTASARVVSSKYFYVFDPGGLRSFIIKIKSQGHGFCVFALSLAHPICDIPNTHAEQKLHADGVAPLPKEKLVTVITQHIQDPSRQPRPCQSCSRILSEVSTQVQLSLRGST